MMNRNCAFFSLIYKVTSDFDTILK